MHERRPIPRPGSTGPLGDPGRGPFGCGCVGGGRVPSQPVAGDPADPAGLRRGRRPHVGGPGQTRAPRGGVQAGHRLPAWRSAGHAGHPLPARGPVLGRAAAGRGLDPRRRVRLRGQVRHHELRQGAGRPGLRGRQRRVHDRTRGAVPDPGPPARRGPRIPGRARAGAAPGSVPVRPGRGLCRIPDRRTGRRPDDQPRLRLPTGDHPQPPARPATGHGAHLWGVRPRPGRPVEPGRATLLRPGARGPTPEPAPP